MKIKISQLRKVIREVLEEEMNCMDENEGIEADTDGQYYDKSSNRNLDHDTEYDKK
jgi:uncharacterized beta-barrel protein YwiB (DUF1934 family)